MALHHVVQNCILISSSFTSISTSSVLISSTILHPIFISAGDVTSLSFLLVMFIVTLGVHVGCVGRVSNSVLPAICITLNDVISAYSFLSSSSLDSNSCSVHFARSLLVSSSALVFISSSGVSGGISAFIMASFDAISDAISLNILICFGCSEFISSCMSVVHPALMMSLSLFWTVFSMVRISSVSNSFSVSTVLAVAGLFSARYFMASFILSFLTLMVAGTFILTNTLCDGILLGSCMFGYASSITWMNSFSFSVIFLSMFAVSSKWNGSHFSSMKSRALKHMSVVAFMISSHFGWYCVHVIFSTGFFSICWSMYISIRSGLDRRLKYSFIIFLHVAMYVFSFAFLSAIFISVFVSWSGGFSFFCAILSFACSRKKS